MFKKALSLLLSLMLFVTTAGVTAVTASAAVADDGSQKAAIGSAGDLTVVATSNFFPETSKSYTGDELDAEDGLVTVTYFIQSDEMLLNTAWLLTYDGNVLEYLPENNTDVMPCATGEMVNTNPKTVPEGLKGVRGNVTNLYMFPLDEKVEFVTATFKVIGSGNTTVDLKVDNLRVSHPNDGEDMTSDENEILVLDNGSVVSEAPITAETVIGDETPVEETTEAPVEETTEAPAEETTEAPVEETTEAPAGDGITVNATSNYFPSASHTYDKDTLDDMGGIVTVNYYINCEENLVNSDWLLTYDGTVLQLEDISMPCAPGAMINTAPASAEYGAKGNYTNLSTVPLTDGDDEVKFVTATFRVIGTGETTVDLKLSQLRVSHLEDGQEQSVKENETLLVDNDVETTNDIEVGKATEITGPTGEPETTAAPEETTAAPEETTAAPEETTAAPAEETTVAPGPGTNLHVIAESNFFGGDDAYYTDLEEDGNGDSFITVTYFVNAPDKYIVNCDIDELTYDPNVLEWKPEYNKTDGGVINFFPAAVEQGAGSGLVNQPDGPGRIVGNFSSVSPAVYAYNDDGSPVAVVQARFKVLDKNAGDTVVRCDVESLAFCDTSEENPYAKDIAVSNRVTDEGIRDQVSPETVLDPNDEEPVEETTEAPEETTEAPEETTVEPEETTVAPEETTAAPEETTAAPEETTAAPEETTAAPEETTAAPEETTAAPEGTTVAPEETTAVPMGDLTVNAVSNYAVPDITTQTVKAGDTVTVSFSSPADLNIVSNQWKLTFDSSKLVLNGVDTFTNDMLLNTENVENGVVQGNVSNISDPYSLTEGANYVIFTFTAKADGEVTVDLDVVDLISRVPDKGDKEIVINSVVQPEDQPEETTEATVGETTGAAPETETVNAVSNYAVPDQATQTVETGQTVTVTFRLPKDADIVSNQWKATFDRNMLQFMSCTTFTDDMMVNKTQLGDGKVQGSVSNISSPYTVSATDKYVELTFFALQEGETTVNLDVVDLLVQDGEDEKEVVINSVVQPDDQPEETTVASEETTAAPEETTVASEETTAEPEETTVASEETTAAPEETTVAPEETTVAPEETTAAPEETTEAPAETTAAPEETTVAPEETTVAPEETTVAPEETSAPPVEETSAPPVEETTVASTTVEPTTIDDNKTDIVDKDTGIKVEDVDKGVVLDVDKISDDDTNKINDKIADNGQVVVVGFDINLTKDGESYTSEGGTVVRIPSDQVDGGKVVLVDKNGNITDMNAVYKDGAYEFTATTNGRYVIIQQKENATTVPGSTSEGTTSAGTTAEGKTVPGTTKGAGSSTSDSTSSQTNGSNNGAVQTGESSMAVVVLLVLMAATAGVFFTRRKTR